MSGDNDLSFAAFLADLLGRIDRGEPIDRERLLADHEVLRPQLESFFRGQSLVGELLRRATAGLSSSQGMGPDGENGRVGRVGEAHAHEPASNGRPNILGFQILEEIGRGGMGIVYLARQLRPERMVALKMVLAGRHASVTALARFQAEAQAAARLRHPSIVPIHEVGEHDGLAYYVMDFIEGESLDDRLARGPLSPRIAAEMLLQIAGAVEHAHQNGVIHRDLKPANVLIEVRNAECGMRSLEDSSPFGIGQGEGAPALTTDHRPPTTCLYIADFGLARILDSNDQLTATGEVVGTASYMAPEQAGSSGQPITASADIYGLGAILYAMLTGRAPFQAASRDETISQLKAKEPAPPRSINAAIPRDLETIVLKCLQKDPVRRYPSAAAVADDLALYLAGRPIKARRAGRVERAWRLVRRNPVTSSLVTLLALSLIAGAAIGIALAIRANQYADDSKHHLYVAHMNLAQQYWDAGRAGPVLDILRRYIPKEGEEDIRGWEWHYQWSLCHRELRRFGEWKTGVQCVAVSPDGTLTAAASDDGLIQVFDTATGDLLSRLTDHKGAVYALAFSPDGSVLASGGVDRHIRIWDASAITPLPSGERQGEGQSNLKAELSNQKLIATFSRHTNDIRGLSFSPDGSKLISSSEGGNAWLWDMKTHEPIRSFATGPARAIAFHPDSQHFACASRDGVIHLWNTNTSRSTAAYSGHSQNVYGIAFSRAADRIFSASSDGLVRCVDTSNGDGIWSIQHVAGFNALSLAADERTLAVGSDDQTVRLYDAGTGDAKGTYRGHINWVQCIAFLPDGSRLLSASADGTVRLWNKLCDEEAWTLHGHEEQVFSVAFSPDGRSILSASLDRTIGVSDAATGLLCRRLRGPLSSVTCVAYGHDGKCFATGSFDANVYLWAPSEPQRFTVLRGHTGPIGGLAFSPDGKLLASCGADDTVRLWSLQEQSAKSVLRAEAGDTYSVTFSPDSQKLLSSHDDGMVRLWSAVDGRLLHACGGHGRNARGISFLRDGKWFASSGGDGTVRIWDSEIYELLQTFHGHDGTVHAIAASRDSKRLISAGQDQIVKLWDIESNQELRTIRFGEPLRSVAFSPDDRQIVTSGANGAVRIFDAGAPDTPLWKNGNAMARSMIDREAIGLVVHLAKRGVNRAAARNNIDADATLNDSVRAASIALLNTFSLAEFDCREGHRLANSGDWSGAAIVFARACEAAPDDINIWYMRALCELKAGHDDQFQCIRSVMLERFRDDKLLVDASCLLNTCLLVPGIPLADLEPLVARLDAGLRREHSIFDGVRRSILAHFAFRRGRFTTSLRYLENAPGENLAGLSWYYLKASVEAMLGKVEARESFSRGELYFAGARIHWTNRVFHEFLRDEARNRIERELGHTR